MADTLSPRAADDLNFTPRARRVTPMPVQPGVWNHLPTKSSTLPKASSNRLPNVIDDDNNNNNDSVFGDDATTTTTSVVSASIDFPDSFRTASAAIVRRYSFSSQHPLEGQGMKRRFSFSSSVDVSSALRSPLARSATQTGALLRRQESSVEQLERQRREEISRRLRELKAAAPPPATTRRQRPHSLGDSGGSGDEGPPPASPAADSTPPTDSERPRPVPPVSSMPTIVRRLPPPSSAGSLHVRTRREGSTGSTSGGPLRATYSIDAKPGSGSSPPVCVDGRRISDEKQLTKVSWTMATDDSGPAHRRHAGDVKRDVVVVSNNIHKHDDEDEIRRETVGPPPSLPPEQPPPSPPPPVPSDDKLIDVLDSNFRSAARDSDLVDVDGRFVPAAVGLQFPEPEHRHAGTVGSADEETYEATASGPPPPFEKIQRAPLLRSRSVSPPRTPTDPTQQHRDDDARPDGDAAIQTKPSADKAPMPGVPVDRSAASSAGPGRISLLNWVDLDDDDEEGRSSRSEKCSTDNPDGPRHENQRKISDDDIKQRANDKPEVKTPAICSIGSTSTAVQEPEVATNSDVIVTPVSAQQLSYAGPEEHLTDNKTTKTESVTSETPHAELRNQPSDNKTIVDLIDLEPITWVDTHRHASEPVTIDLMTSLSSAGDVTTTPVSVHQLSSAAPEEHHADIKTTKTTSISSETIRTEQNNQSSDKTIAPEPVTRVDATRHASEPVTIDLMTSPSSSGNVTATPVSVHQLSSGASEEHLADNKTTKKNSLSSLTHHAAEKSDPEPVTRVDTTRHTPEPVTVDLKATASSAGGDTVREKTNSVTTNGYSIQRDDDEEDDRRRHSDTIVRKSVCTTTMTTATVVNLQEGVTSAPGYQVLDMDMIKDCIGLGFCIEGGAEFHGRWKPITVRRLFKGETWAKNNLEAGDEIVQVNDVSFDKMYHHEAWTFLKSLPDGITRLRIRRKL